MLYVNTVMRGLPHNIIKSRYGVKLQRLLISNCNYLFINELFGVIIEQRNIRCFGGGIAPKVGFIRLLECKGVNFEHLRFKHKVISCNLFE